MYGLKYIPNLGSDELNNRDMPYVHKKPPHEFSADNHQVVRDELVAIKDKCNVILEIGVARNGAFSSYGTFCKNKRKEALFLGVDVEDRSWIEDIEGNVRFMQTNSSNTEEILNKIEELAGTRTIDFLHIDGWHSVNQIVDDFRFAEHLSPHGVIAVHDTTGHPGPIELFKALDPEVFVGTKYFENRSDDWGIGIIKRV